jgi:hypothetical protein
MVHVHLDHVVLMLPFRGTWLARRRAGGPAVVVDRDVHGESEIVEPR